MAKVSPCSPAPCPQAIVVGGGLAGMTAANTILENGGRVLILDKSSFCGGNSTKATSGISGAGTRAQEAKGIKDTSDDFARDTLKGGAKKPELVQVLCGNSGADIDWLAETFDLDLSLLARLGGHSVPRTHRGTERFPGMTITYALIGMVEKIAERTDRARIVTKARAHTLLTGSAGECAGLIYERGGVNHEEHGPVILATGGYGADFTQDSLLCRHRPDLRFLATTSGEHCTGDGIKMGEAIGGRSVDLEWVQVHPTGLIRPDDPDAKIKFLAAEALRGVGGLILDGHGRRFANELGRNDYVTREMWKNEPPFRLVLNKAASQEILFHCKHYTGRGVMKFYKDGVALAQDMGVPLSVLEQTHEEHFQAAKKMEKDPDGGPWPAYPSGKSWDQASGTTGAGKKFFHNILPGSAVKSQPFFAALITPVIHYTVGGLEIDAASAVVGQRSEAIPGLYAAGEVTGGVHGSNRLGGNALLDCVVFGRVAGKACVKLMLGADVQETSLKELSAGELLDAGQSSKPLGAPSAVSVGAAFPAAVAAPVAQLTLSAEVGTSILAEARSLQKTSGGFAGARYLHRVITGERWGITKEVLGDFGERVKDMLAKRLVHNSGTGQFAYSQALFNDPGIGPNCYQINEQVIMPVTKSDGLEFPGVSWSLMDDPLGKHVTIFVTHAWAEGVFEFVNNVLAKWPEGPGPGGVEHAAYICFLSNPQHLDITDMLKEIETSPFKVALSKMPRPGLMIVSTTQACPIHSRLWCVAELFWASEQGTPIVVGGASEHLAGRAAAGAVRRQRKREDVLRNIGEELQGSTPQQHSSSRCCCNLSCFVCLLGFGLVVAVIILGISASVSAGDCQRASAPEACSNPYEAPAWICHVALLCVVCPAGYMLARTYGFWLDIFNCRQILVMLVQFASCVVCLISLVVTLALGILMAGGDCEGFASQDCSASYATSFWVFFVATWSACCTGCCCFAREWCSGADVDGTNLMSRLEAVNKLAEQTQLARAGGFVDVTTANVSNPDDGRRIREAICGKEARLNAILGNLILHGDTPGPAPVDCMNKLEGEIAQRMGLAPAGPQR